jgi:hypothetical protein
MKRLHYIFIALGIMASAAMLSSCEYIEDGQKAMVLSGEWRGDFGMYYDYEDRYGHVYTFDSYDTYITFIPDYDHAHHGRGTQVDYYANGPYEYMYYHFSWSVEGSIIYLWYDENPDLDTRISDYHMTNDYLTGVFPYSGTKFRLYKLTDYYDWTPYVNTCGYYSRDNWSVSRAEGEELSDSTAATGQIISRGRRTTPLKQ